VNGLSGLAGLAVVFFTALGPASAGAALVDAAEPAYTGIYPARQLARTQATPAAQVPGELEPLLGGPAPESALKPLITPAVPGLEENSPYLLERAQFQAAVAAIARGNRPLFDALHTRLRHYPIERYLSYLGLRDEMSQQADKLSVKALNRFEKTYRDERLTRVLTRHLQRQLVDAEDWALFLGVSKSRLAANMPCARARALKETGKLGGWDDELTQYWIRKNSYPDLCRQALVALEKRTLPGIGPLWEKIYRSISDGQRKNALKLAERLARADRQRVEAWVAAFDKPAKLLQSAAMKSDDHLNRKRVIDLTRRWSRLDPPAAVEYWYQAREGYAFSDDDRYAMDRELALRGAWLRREEAYDWLAAVPARENDLELKGWRIRAALYANAWPQVLESLQLLPAAELAEAHWAYWHARALDEAGRAGESEKIMRRVASLPTYYGFLAADRLGLEYNIVEHLDTQAEPSIQRALREQPELVRAREYLHAGLPSEGRREWNRFLALESVEPHHQVAAALLAEQWGLPDRAIASANAAGEKKALSLRFPFAYSDLVAKAASDNQLDPEFIYAVIRRESAYMVDIRSSAGALGLMQLMPATAKDATRMLGQTPNGAGQKSSRWVELTDPADNIQLASRYLRYIMDRFDNDLVLTAASYNAGPHRTLAWLPESGEVPADQWIDTIPFSETRRYVRAILAYMTIFEWRKQQAATGNSSDAPAGAVRVSDRLSVITAQDIDKSSAVADSNN